MDESDVALLDGHVEALDKWMGCILCPDPACMQDKVNLLVQGVKVPFYKRKKGVKATYSRQASFGICLPIDLIASPEHLREVSAQIALWAWDGGAVISSLSDKSTIRDNLLNKTMMCTKGRHYRPSSAQEVCPHAPHLYKIRIS